MQGFSPSAPYVLVLGATPRFAMDVGDAVRSVAGEAELRASAKDRWHYKKPSWGFRFGDLDPNDPIEGSLVEAQDADRRDWAEVPSGGSAFSDAVTLVVVGFLLGIPEGAGQEMGADAYRGAKSRIRRFWRGVRGVPKAHGQADSELGRLFDEMDMAFTSSYLSGHDPIAMGPIFIRVLEPDITFLTEPYLPKRAKGEAVRIAMRPEEYGDVRTPLRWNRDRELWEALPDDWALRDQLNALRRELMDEVSCTEHRDQR